jgi:hypothetical protein
MKRVKYPPSLSPLLRKGLRSIPLLSSLLCFELAAALLIKGRTIIRRIRRVSHGANWCPMLRIVSGPKPIIFTQPQLPA